ncbi:MAG: hypothetical protein MZV64_11770 [Ignavibacteriales bacterium]|nr:hypothetical protein [Ignavibacteriales bacterium]
MAGGQGGPAVIARVRPGRERQAGRPDRPARGRPSATSATLHGRQRHRPARVREGPRLHGRGGTAKADRPGGGQEPGRANLVLPREADLRLEALAEALRGERVARVPQPTRPPRPWSSWSPRCEARLRGPVLRAHLGGLQDRRRAWPRPGSASSVFAEQLGPTRWSSGRGHRLGWPATAPQQGRARVDQPPTAASASGACSTRRPRR